MDETNDIGVYDHLRLLGMTPGEANAACNVVDLGTMLQTYSPRRVAEILADRIKRKNNGRNEAIRRTSFR